MNKIKNLFTPFEHLNSTNKTSIMGGWLVIIIGLWFVAAMGDTHMFPTPTQVFTGVHELWGEGLVVQIGSSICLCAQAVALSVIISLIFAYTTPLPFFKPMGAFISKLRYLPLTGISFYIAIMIHDARAIQIWVLVVFMTTFLTTSLIQMISDIPEEELDHAKTLGCTRWEILWEVVIKGRVDYVLELVRQSLAIVWVMLVTVESILMAAGGLGTLIKNSDKTGNNGRVIALQIIIILLGVSLDFLITITRKLSFRYSNF